jgi:hypothetical protein
MNINLESYFIRDFLDKLLGHGSGTWRTYYDGPEFDISSIRQGEIVVIHLQRNDTISDELQFTFNGVEPLEDIVKRFRNTLVDLLVKFNLLTVWGENESAIIM